MADIRTTTTYYVHPTDPNLLNIHKAMKFNSDGEPVVRAHVDGISLQGDVIVDTVSLSSSTLAALESINIQNTVSVTVSNFPTTSTVYQGTIPWVTTVTNWPALQYVNGTVYAVQSGTWNVGVSGSVAVTNFTSTVNVASLPAITGTVTVSGSVTVTNFTSTVNVASLPAITGTVAVSNFTSTVHVDNFPTSVTVTNFTSTVNINTMPSVTITNTSFAVTNFPTTSTVYQGTNPWVVTGTVAVNSMPVVQITGTVTIESSTATIGTEVSYIRDDNNTQLDMSGRLRIAQIGQQWWFVPMVDKDGDLRYGESTTGTSAVVTFVQNLASVYLTSGTDSTGQATRYSRRRHKMRPGVSHQWFTSLNFDGTQTNVTKRVGMFTTYNGVFFELTDDLYAVVRRRLTDGTLLEKRIKRDQFTHDHLDGTGPSQYNWVATTSSNLTAASTTTVVTVNSLTNNLVYQVTYTHDGTADERFQVGDKVVVSGMTPTTLNNTPIITALTSNTVRLAYAVNPGTFSSMSSGNISKNGFTRHHTLFIDFNGSRTGHVRFCLMGPLGPETLHVEDYSDAIGTGAWNAPALMERADIVNTGVVNHLPSMTIGGSAFNIEAEAELSPAFGTAISTATVDFVKSGVNTDVGHEYALMGVGLRAGEPYQRADLQINRFQIVDTGNLNPQNAGILQWRLVLNPTLIGTIPDPQNVGKATRFWDYAKGVTCSTGTGITLQSGFAQGTFTGENITALNFLNMGSNLDYTDADKVVLFVKLLVGGSDDSRLLSVMNFTESL